jgi:hypothetical protein
MLAEMGAFNEELVTAGILLDRLDLSGSRDTRASLSASFCRAPINDRWCHSSVARRSQIRIERLSI